MHWLRWRRTGSPFIVRPNHTNSGSFKKGLIPHNKGKSMSKAEKERSRQSHLGQTPWNRGIPMREESKAKLRGKPKSEETIAKIKAKRATQVLSSEHGKNISVALRGKPKSPEHVAKLSGPNHYRWKGGQVRSMSKSAWRRVRAQVLERDSYTCQHCRRTGITLIAHHIIEYPVGSDELDNLISLCRSCHVRHHSLKNKEREL